MMNQSAVIIYSYKQKWNKYISVQPYIITFIQWHTQNSMNHVCNVPCRNSQFMGHVFIVGWWKTWWRWEMGLLYMLRGNGMVFLLFHSYHCRRGDLLLLFCFKFHWPKTRGWITSIKPPWQFWSTNMTHSKLQPCTTACTSFADFYTVTCYNETSVKECIGL